MSAPTPTAHASSLLPSLKAIPANRKAEAAVIATMMHEDGNLVHDEIIESVDSRHFHSPDLRIVFEAICAMRGSGKPVDMVTLTDHLASVSLLDAAGGPAALADLATEHISKGNIPHHLDILVKQHLLREVLRISRDYTQRVIDSPDDPQKIFDAMQGEISVAQESIKQAGDTIMLRDYIVEAIDQVEFAYKNRGKPTGISTGFTDLDRQTNGLHPGHLVVVAGRPAMGKSSFGLQLAINAARAGHTTAFVSMEMPGSSLAKRAVFSEAEVSLQKANNGFISMDHDWPRIVSASAEVSKLPLIVHAASKLDIFDLRAKARRWHREQQLAMLVVDYIGLMSASGKQAESNRQIEMSLVSLGLKAIAMELNIPVIVLAQLNRKVEERPGKRPMMSDLRESGSIEQDADLILLLYREEYYKPKPPTDDDPGNLGLAEIIIAKQRDGGTNPVKLRFEAELTKFYNLTEKLYSNNPDEHMHYE